jgi:hypothetical protein
VQGKSGSMKGTISVGKLWIERGRNPSRLGMDRSTAPHLASLSAKRRQMDAQVWSECNWYISVTDFVFKATFTGESQSASLLICKHQSHKVSQLPLSKL